MTDMEKARWRRTAACLAALCATALLAAAFPAFQNHILRPISLLPPGARKAERRLITVWNAGELPGATAWLREQAAAYEKAHPGDSVWLRRVTGQDIREMDAAPPDLLTFSAEVSVPEGEAVPLCLSGYALMLPEKETVTEAPRSLFGVSPTPDPAVTPRPPQGTWPERFAVDDGFGALALASLGGHTGGCFVPGDEVLKRFLNGEAALLSANQIVSLARNGAGGQALAAASATDLVLYAAAREETGAGGDFLRFLLSRKAQRALASQGLFTVLPGLRLYGADRPALQTLEAALARARLAPAVSWPAIKKEMILTAQALYEAGESASGLLDELSGL